SSSLQPLCEAIVSPAATAVKPDASIRPIYHAAVYPEPAKYLSSRSFLPAVVTTLKRSSVHFSLPCLSRQTKWYFARTRKLSWLDCGFIFGYLHQFGMRYAAVRSAYVTQGLARARLVIDQKASSAHLVVLGHGRALQLGNG